MAIITISRGSFSNGKEIAEKVAETLGYQCASREVLLEASQFFQVSEKKLLETLHDAPSFLERLSRGREKYIAYIRAALLEHIKGDNYVYHGHAGHLLIPEITNALKVRIIADMDERVALLRQRQKMSKNHALAVIREEDRHRKEWTRYLYRVDIEDPRLYDIIVYLGTMTIEDACQIICNAARCKSFKTTPEDKRTFVNLALQSHIRASLQTLCEASVTALDGFVHVKVPAQKLTRTGFATPQMGKQLKETIQSDLTKEINEIVRKIPGVKEVVCDIEPPFFV